MGWVAPTHRAPGLKAGCTSVAPKWTICWSNPPPPPPNGPKNNKCARTPEPPKNTMGCNRALKRVKRLPSGRSSGACTTVVQNGPKKQQLPPEPPTLYTTCWVTS